MKSSTIGLALGALNMATTKASLFEEDFQLADFAADFDTDLAEAADFDDDFFESDGRMLQNASADEPADEEDDQGDSRKGRRGRGRGRGRGKGRGRKNRKGRKGKGKKNKEPFNYNEKVAKIGEMKAKKEAALPEKCDKKLDMGQKICETVEKEEDKARCFQWIQAKNIQCKEQGKCKIQMKHDKQMCSAQFKYFMQGIWKEDVQVPADITSEAIGRCFQVALDDIAACTDQARLAVVGASEGLEPPTEAEEAAFKQAMKQMRKQERKANKKNRKGKKKNKKNKWQRKQQKKNKWRKKQQWKKEQESNDEDMSDDMDEPEDEVLELEEELDGLN